MGVAVCFNPPWELTPCWKPAQTHIKCTFPTDCIHIFAIWCVSIFSEGPLVELFNCHHCKGQRVIFSMEPLLQRNFRPGQARPIILFQSTVHDYIIQIWALLRNEWTKHKNRKSTGSSFLCQKANKQTRSSYRSKVSSESRRKGSQEKHSSCLYASTWKQGQTGQCASGVQYHWLPGFDISMPQLHSPSFKERWETSHEYLKLCPLSHPLSRL